MKLSALVVIATMTLTVRGGAATAADELAQRLPDLPAPKVVAYRITMLPVWVASVEKHTPGESDEVARAILKWTADDITRAWVEIQALVAIVKNPAATRFTLQPSGETIDVSRHRADRAALHELAGRVRTRAGGPDLFYKHAAVLHADVAMHGGSTAEISLTRSLMVKTRDGAQLGLDSNRAHWEIGRLLLDALHDPSRDVFVRDWYRATMAAKLRKGDLDTPHFERAGQILTNDAPVRFFIGSLHEWFADPRVQRASETITLPLGFRLEVKGLHAELRHAEAEFRRALAIDPGHTEARVRLGRVLSRLEKHTEAAVELRVAIKTAAEPLVIYYAQLFLAAEEEALGDFAQARVAFQKAAEHYPHAQAPRLGLSQLAHRTGDRVAARDALAPALQRDRRRPADDPWWTYRSAPSRHTDDLLAAVYRSVHIGAMQ